MNKRTDTQLAAIFITQEEQEKLSKLAEHFNTTQYGAIEKGAEYINQIEQINIGIKVRKLSAKRIHKKLLFTQEFYDALDEYSIAHFRDITSTIRYIINGAYKIIFEK